MTNDDELGIDSDVMRYARATDPEKLPSLHGDIPDWITDMDRQILHVLMFGHILTPAIIAENIDRSRGAVARRLKTLEAGGFVEKIDRGKYSITAEGGFAVTGDPDVFESTDKE